MTKQANVKYKLDKNNVQLRINTIDRGKICIVFINTKDKQRIGEV